MSEYIVAPKFVPVGKSGIGMEYEAVCEIVRCRDCRFSLAHGNGCGRNQDIYDAEPNGFCAWAERKEVDA